MTTNRTIARPYAKAIFEGALSRSQLKEWYQILFVLGKTVENKKFMITISNPSFSTDKIFKYLSDIYTSALPNLKNTLKIHFDNFIKLLIHYKRLIVLPDLFKMYQKLCYAHEKISIIHVTSAFNLSSSQKQRLISTLEKYFKTSVQVCYKIDSSLIGGLTIQSDNLLIDGSIKNQLKRLKYQLIQT